MSGRYGCFDGTCVPAGLPIRWLCCSRDIRCRRLGYFAVPGTHRGLVMVTAITATTRKRVVSTAATAVSKHACRQDYTATVARPLALVTSSTAWIQTSRQTAASRTVHRPPVVVLWLTGDACTFMTAEITVAGQCFFNAGAGGTLLLAGLFGNGSERHLRNGWCGLSRAFGVIEDPATTRCVFQAAVITPTAHRTIHFAHRVPTAASGYLCGSIGCSLCRAG